MFIQTIKICVTWYKKEITLNSTKNEPYRTCVEKHESKAYVDKSFISYSYFVDPFWALKWCVCVACVIFCQASLNSSYS